QAVLAERNPHMMTASIHTRMLTRTRLIAAAFVVAAAVVLLLGLPYRSDRVVVFEPVSRLHSPLRRLLVKRGNEVTDPDVLYPASLFATFDEGCSATIVGADSLLTSGHCARIVAAAGMAIQLTINGATSNATCTESDVADLALCKLDPDVSGIVFDVIERDATKAVAGNAILLTGWADPPSSNPLVRFFRRLLRRLGIGSAFKTGSGTITATTDTLTVDGNVVSGVQVVLEPGDSGGAGYATPGATRTIIGVNRCGGPGCGYGATAGTSVLVNVTNDTVAAWIERWANGPPAK